MRLLILLLLFSTGAFAQRFPPIYGKIDYVDSLQSRKYKNNLAQDSVLSTDTSGKFKMAYRAPGSSGWALPGNAGTNPMINFIGTTDNVDFVAKRNSVTAFTLKSGVVEFAEDIKLPQATASTAGVIYKGNNRFMHAFQNTGTLGGNTFLGTSAGNFTNTGGYYNTGIGQGTLFGLTTAFRSTAVGHAAAQNTTTGFNTTAIGASSLQFNTTGFGNTGVGTRTLTLNTTGYQNVAMGVDALFTNTTGYYNVGVGLDALYLQTTGKENTAVGDCTLVYNTTGSNLVGIGYRALHDHLTGNYNTAVGDSTAQGIKYGSNNTILGARISGLDSNLNDHVIISNGKGLIRIKSDSSGKMQFPLYGSGTFTGTAATYPAFDASGNLIEITSGGGTVTGTGSLNTLQKIVTAPNTIGNSSITDNGSSIVMNPPSAGPLLEVLGALKVRDSINFKGLLPMSGLTDSLVVRNANGRLGTIGKGALTPTLPATRIAFGDSSNLMTGSSNLTYDAETLGLNVAVGGVVSAGPPQLGTNGVTGVYGDGSDAIVLGDFNDNGNSNKIYIKDVSGVAYYDNTSHTGKFGINTSSPSVALDVVGNVKVSDASLLSVTLNGSGGIPSFVLDGNDFLYKIGDFNGSGSGNSLTLDAGNGFTYFDGVSHETKVGINTSTPSYPLDVNGDVNVYSSTYPNGLFNINGGGDVQMGDINGNVNSTVLLVSDPTSKGYFSNGASNAKFGINTFSPSVALDVVGDVQLTGSVKASSGVQLTLQNDDASGAIVIDAPADESNISLVSTGDIVFSNGGDFKVNNLSGTGTRAVVSDAIGVLSATNAAYNTKAGSFSGVGTATTTFTVTFGGTLPSATYSVNVTPTSALSAALFYVTNKTTTTFDVTYLAGLTGTVTFDYILAQ